MEMKVFYLFKTPLSIQETQPVLSCMQMDKNQRRWGGGVWSVLHYVQRKSSGQRLMMSLQEQKQFIYRGMLTVLNQNMSNAHNLFKILCVV